MKNLPIQKSAKAFCCLLLLLCLPFSLLLGQNPLSFNFSPLDLSPGNSTMEPEIAATPIPFPAASNTLPALQAATAMMACTNPPGDLEPITFQYVYGDAAGQSTIADALAVTCDGGYAVVGNTDAGRFYFFKTDANGVVEFSKYFDHATFDLTGHGVVYTEDDGYLLYGVAGSTAQLNRVFLLKTDLDGVPVWTKSFELDLGSPANDLSFEAAGVAEIIEAADGNYIVAIQNAKKVIMKIDPDGNVLSSAMMSNPGQFLDYATDMAPTSDGGAILTGFAFTSGVPLIKIDAALNIQFAREFNDALPFSSCEDVGGQVLQTPDGGYLITGGTKSHGNAVCNASFGGYYNAFVLKANATGNFVWGRVFGNGGTGDFGTGIYPIDNEAYLFSILAGSDGDNGSLVYGSINQSSGTVNWLRSVDGACSESGAVMPTGYGGYILNGNTSSAGSGENDHLLIKMNNSLTFTGCLSSSTSTIANSTYTPSVQQAIPEQYFTGNAILLPLTLTVTDAASFEAKSTCTCSTVVTTTADDDCVGSLRSAIRCANLNPGADTISFDIDPAVFGAGPYVFYPKSPFQDLTGGSTVMDGTTQPGNFPMAGLVVVDGDSLANLAQGGDGMLNMEGAGSALYAVVVRNSPENALRVSANNVIVGMADKGNVLLENPDGHGVYLDASGESCIIRNNFIGVQLDGSATGSNNGDGIYIVGSSNHAIDGNCIGFCQNGINLQSSNGNIITRNKIGVSTLGEALPNMRGIRVQGSQNTLGDLDAENEIAHNTQQGVLGTVKK